jgi:hypothetical protein
MKASKRPRRPRMRARPLGQKPNPKAWDMLREMEELVWALRNGMSLEAKKRTSWYSSTS